MAHAPRTTRPAVSAGDSQPTQPPRNGPLYGAHCYLQGRANRVSEPWQGNRWASVL